MKPFTTINRGNNRLEVVASAKETPQVILTGTVGQSFWDDSGITAKEVRSAFKTIPRGTKFEVIGSSEGGSVKEGLEIYDAIDDRSEDITYRVAGYALSIASVFPLAASKVISPKHAIWMMHEAHCLTAGNKRDKAKDVEMLAEHDEMMAEIYAEKTGRPIQEMRDAMAAETWIRGSAAVDFGLADQTDETEPANAAYRPLPAAYLDRCKNSGPILNLFSPASGTQEGSAKNKPNSTAARGGAADDPMKAKIIALLKKHGVEVKDDWTDEQIQDALDKIPTTKTDDSDKSGKTVILDAGLSAQITAMQAQLAHEKKTRVLAKIGQFIDEQRLTNEEKEDALKRSMADESYLEIIAKRPQAIVGGTPVQGGIIQISGEDPILDLKKKHPVVSARYAVMGQDWDQILLEACRRDVRSGSIQDARFCALTRAGLNPFSEKGTQLPLAANTITNVLTNFLKDGSVTNLQNMWAALGAFSLDTRPDGYKPLAPGILKHVTAADAGQTDATNYETSGNTTVAPVTITPHEHSKSYQISNTDLNSGVRMMDLVTLNTAVFADLVMVAAVTPISVANFGAATVVRAAELFSFTDLAALQAALKKSPIKNLIIDGAYIARISNIPSFFQVAGTVGGGSNAWRGFGWNVVANNTTWTGAAANTQGFACNPQAIGGIIGLPLLPAIIPGNILSSEVLTVPGLDIQVLAEAWFNPATRTSWNSLRVMDGFTAVDTTAGFIIASA